MKKKENNFHRSLRACLTALLMTFATAIYAQNVTVKGSVEDANGEPIIGASVKTAEQRTGTVTKKRGRERPLFLLKGSAHERNPFLQRRSE